MLLALAVLLSEEALCAVPAACAWCFWGSTLQGRHFPCWVWLVNNWLVPSSCLSLTIAGSKTQASHMCPWQGSAKGVGTQIH